jgi:DNA-binding beta-propeller fold protein YncE
MRVRKKSQRLGVLLALIVIGRTSAGAPKGPPSLPLTLVADVPLPGKAVRFDYQDIDPIRGRLFIAHMDDASVVVVNTKDGSLVKVLSGIQTPRGVVVANDVKRVFVTSSPSSLVIIDSESLTEVGRVPTGHSPDGVAWDPGHRVVGVSDQADGALSLISDAGNGSRRQVALGVETGNVIFDATRAMFWLTVVSAKGPNELVSVDPIAARAVMRIPLPGCSGAHGLRIHPNGRSALIACEENSKVARVNLVGTHAVDLAASGHAPDVLAIDSRLQWLYVASESGDLRVFDLTKPGLMTIRSQYPGNASHSVLVDSATHWVFFPLVAGKAGTPVLRIMRPTGT